MKQLAGQLQFFDSVASTTMRRISVMLKGAAPEQRFAPLEGCINAYDYESALAEIQLLNKQRALKQSFID